MCLECENHTSTSTLHSGGPVCAPATHFVAAQDGAPANINQV